MSYGYSHRQELRSKFIFKSPPKPKKEFCTLCLLNSSSQVHNQSTQCVFLQHQSAHSRRMQRPIAAKGSMWIRWCKISSATWYRACVLTLIFFFIKHVLKILPAQVDNFIFRWNNNHFTHVSINLQVSRLCIVFSETVYKYICTKLVVTSLSFSFNS